MLVCTVHVCALVMRWADLFVENSNASSVVASLTPVATPVKPEPTPVAVTPVTPATIVPPPALPMPPVTPPEHPFVAKWNDQLRQMAEMGFFDVRANIAALEKHSGNVSRAVEHLLTSA